MMTISQIRCLLALNALREHHGAVASKDIARLLGISRPSVHRLLGALAEEGLVIKERYGSVQLSEQGIETASQLEARRDCLTLFFARSCLLPMDESTNAAMLLMSGLQEQSLQTLEKAESLLG